MTSHLDEAEVTGPWDLRAPLRAVLSVMEASWKAWASRGDYPSVCFDIGEVDGENVCEGRVAGVSDGAYRIEVRVSRPVPLDRLRHCVGHELGHVLINTWVDDRDLCRGFAGEYAAERIGWDILRGAGLEPNVDVFVSPERENQRAWLPVLVRIFDQIDASPWRAGDEDTPHLRAQSRRFRAGFTLCRSEAYRRGQHDAGVEVINEADVPEPLRRELDRVFASLSVSPFPVVVSPESLLEFLSRNTSTVMDSERDFVLEHLPGVVDEVRADLEDLDREAA